MTSRINFKFIGELGRMIRFRLSLGKRTAKSLRDLGLFRLLTFTKSLGFQDKRGNRTVLDCVLISG